jgi:glyoxylase-like metal-dependent hydrolase (beta-lactamase superfamily II)
VTHLRTAVLTAVSASLALQPASPASNFDVRKLSDHVYAVVRRDPPGFMVDANNAFILADDAVVVVDANGAPAITREVLKAIRRITKRPVRYVVNTHYHDDHIRGNSVYREAFPGVRFVGHAFTREYLPNQGAANRKSFLEGAPRFADELRGLLASGKNLSGGLLTGATTSGPCWRERRPCGISCS